MGYVLGNKSRRRLYGVHPDLVLVVNKAIEITTQDFTVLEGLRTLERQQQLYNTGKSKTMNSRHLTGHAVDLAPWPISWDWEYFYPIAEAMKDASDEVGVPIEWGGDWKSFPDGPHFQLPHKDYPA
jgi:peptidoglycan L-alanyl-D-glutamate endopeptidase CwlK